MQSGRSAAKILRELQNRMVGNFDCAAGCTDRGSLHQRQLRLGTFLQCLAGTPAIIEVRRNGNIVNYFVYYFFNNNPHIKHK
jgi:hypothetical protein